MQTWWKGIERRVQSSPVSQLHSANTDIPTTGDTSDFTYLLQWVWSEHTSGIAWSFLLLTCVTGWRQLEEQGTWTTARGWSSGHEVSPCGEKFSPTVWQFTGKCILYKTVHCHYWISIVHKCSSVSNWCHVQEVSRVGGIADLPGVYSISNYCETAVHLMPYILLHLWWAAFLYVELNKAEVWAMWPFSDKWYNV